MEQPKKDKKKITTKVVGTGNLNGELRLTPEEESRNAKVTKMSKDKSYQEKMQKEAGLKIDDSGKSQPIPLKDYEIEENDRSTGKKSRILKSDKSVYGEAWKGTPEWDELVKKSKKERENSNKGRKRQSDVLNYQTGEKEGNVVYEDKMKTQRKGDAKRESLKTRVKLKK